MTNVNTEKVGKALEKVAATPQDSLISMINASQKELARALPKHLSADRLARIATTCIRQNPTLAKCTPASFLGALFTSAQIGLEPVAGLAYLIPFQNNRKIGDAWAKVWEVQYVIGYKGVSELFYRHEKGGLVDWGTVHENDEFDYEFGTNAHLKHKPAIGERGKVKGYYVIFKLSGGFTKFHYMTVQECMEHGKKHSKTFDHNANSFNKKSPWATNPEPMCLKTVLLQGSKTVPLATELRQALETDETSREFKAGVGDAFAMPVTSWTDADIEPERKALPAANTATVAQTLSEDELKRKAEDARAKKEQMEAEERSKAETEGTGETPSGDPSGQSDEPSSSGLYEEPPPAKRVTLTGLVADHKQMGKGPHRFYVEGKWAQTFDKKISMVLRDHKENDNEVRLECHEEHSASKDGREFTNIVIDEATAI